LDLQPLAQTIAQILAIVAVVGLGVGIVSYLLPRTQVGKAAERYTDALEGENEVSRRVISRLETDVTSVRQELERTLLKVTQLESDIGVAKAENDRLRAENTRLHDRLAAHGLDEG
jgi:chromosome segregation ATPase